MKNDRKTVQTPREEVKKSLSKIAKETDIFMNADELRAKLHPGTEPYATNPHRL